MIRRTLMTTPITSTLAGAAAVAIAAAATLGGTTPAQAQATDLTLKSASSSSSYYVMMVQLAELLGDTDAINPTVEESQGSVQNVKESARRDGAFLFTTPPSLLAAAQAGTGPFEGDSADYSGARTLFVMPFVTIHFVVSADSGVTDVMDLAGQTFIPGGTGTFCERRTRAILDIFGLTDEVEFVETELNNAGNALRNDRVTGFATCSSHPTPQLVELSSTTDLHVISFTADQRQQLIDADPLSGPITIAAGTYSGQEADVETVGVPVGAYGTTNMDDDTAYTIAKTFWENKDALAAENPWWDGVTPDLMAQLGEPMHPGALRYYDEIGVDVPDAMR